MTGKPAGAPPPTLLDYLHEDTIIVIDESHQTVPQLGAMYKGDRSRKGNLVEYGFRLPSAMDNRPLNFEEFNERIDQTIYVSATPGNYELEKTEGEVIEQVIRPTGLLDPVVEVRPVKGQIDDLLEECRLRAERDERILVTTLTKKDVGKSDRIFCGSRCKSQLFALGHRNFGKNKNPAKSSARRI